MFKLEDNVEYSNLYAKMSNLGMDLSTMFGVNLTHFLQLYANYCFFSYYLGGTPDLYDGDVELPDDAKVEIPWGDKHPLNGKPLLKIGLRCEF